MEVGGRRGTECCLGGQERGRWAGHVPGEGTATANLNI